MHTTSIIDLLGQAIGAVATMRLLALFGGRKLYVPEEMSEDHPIALAIGIDAARELSRQFTREQLELPDGDEFARLRRVRRVAGLLRHSTPPRDVAMLIGISTKQVARYRAEAEQLGLLPSVFDRPEDIRPLPPP